MAEQIRVVLVDDMALIRHGLTVALEADGRATVVGEAGSVAEATDTLRTTAPHVVVIDVGLPDGNGIALCRDLATTRPSTRCVLFTAFPKEQALLAAAVAGAAGYLDKRASADEVVDTIVAAGRGEVVLDRERVDRQIRELADLRPVRLHQLTSVQHDLLELVGQGLSDYEIADRLHLSSTTVRSYVSRLLVALRMDRRSEVAALAARLAARHAPSTHRG